ncbi:MAG: tandem-95 repeat protein, partial [Hyphomicrobiales bacterium]
VVITAAQLLAGVTDIDGPAATITALSVASGGGTLVQNSPGVWTYTPAANYAGPVAFSYTASDGSASTSATATLAVAAVNDAPVLEAALADQSVAEEGVVNFTIPAGAFSDVDGNALTLSTSALPAWLSFDAATRTFSGTAPADFNGFIDVTVTASDGALSASDTFRLTVTPVNDAPVVSGPVTLPGIQEDSAGVVITAAQLLGNASDVDSTLTVTGLTVPAAQGTLVSNGGGIWVFTPAANFSGAAVFSYSVSDGTAPPVATTASLDVMAVNDGPNGVIVVGSPLATDEIAAVGTVVGKVSGTSLDAGVTFTYSFANNPNNIFAIASLTGLITVNDGILIDFEQAASHSVTVRATDNNNLSFDQILTITVNDINPENVTGDIRDNILVGGASADTLSGGFGNDTLIGGGGNDTIAGGIGNDTLFGDAGDDAIDGGDGNDTIFGGDGIDTVEGGIGNDIINLGNGNDVASGGDGNDIISGEAGDDIIMGGSGQDVLIGGAGNDRIYGGLGDDSIYGGIGNDIAIGDDGND